MKKNKEVKVVCIWVHTSFSLWEDFREKFTVESVKVLCLSVNNNLVNVCICTMNKYHKCQPPHQWGNATVWFSQMTLAEVLLPALSPPSRLKDTSGHRCSASDWTESWALQLPSTLTRSNFEMTVFRLHSHTEKVERIQIYLWCVKTINQQVN